jgi:hypothetical protein
MLSQWPYSEPHRAWKNERIDRQSYGRIGRGMEGWTGRQTDRGMNRDMEGKTRQRDG